MNRRPGHPDKQFDEVQFAHEVWSVLLGHHSDVIDCRTGTHILRLSSTYTLNSTRYNDAFIEGFLHRASLALKMLLRLAKFSSSLKQSRLTVDPLPLIPFRKAGQKFYNEIVATIDSYGKTQMVIDQLEFRFDDLFSHLEIVYNLCLPLIRSKSLEQTHNVLSDIQNSMSFIMYRDEIEETWRQYFYKLFVCPDAYYLRLSFWQWVFDCFFEILPNYLDKIAEFADIRIDAEKDKIVLFDDSHQEYAYFRCLWSDRLISLVKRAFADRKRLFARSKNSIAASKLLSAYFNEELKKFKNDNREMTKLTDIKLPTLVSLIESSCQLYVYQFSKLILNELQYKNRLVSRIKELTGICSLQPFIAQVNRLSSEDHVNGDRNNLLQAYKTALMSPVLDETTQKYWSVVLADRDEFNPYAFKIQSKFSWPTNLVITRDFMDNLEFSLRMMMRLFYYYTNFRAISITCMFANGGHAQLVFTLKTQNFVLALRQILHRLFNCLVKKVGVEMQTLLQIVEKATNFNDLEANVNKWHEGMRFFATESHFALGISNLFNCADAFISTCEMLSQHVTSSPASADQSGTLELITLENRRDFVLACESLTPPLQDTSVVELSPFEREISLIVSHITSEKFWQTT